PNRQRGASVELTWLGLKRCKRRNRCAAHWTMEAKSSNVVTLDERFFEFRHLVFTADRDADMIRPYRPGPTDVDLFSGHVGVKLFARTLHVDHEAIAFRGNEIDILGGKEIERILADVGHDLAALRYKILHLQAGGRANHA